MSIEIENKINFVVEWLKEKVRESKTNGLLVGISGGIDSAVVANLIKKACPENSLGVILPVGSSNKDVEDGLLTAKKCGIRHITIDLTDEKNSILNKVTTSLTDEGLYSDESSKLTDANLRARLRMSTLYALANQLNYLVVGTDNAAEVYTGYFTKYGDGGVDILPIAALKKYEVYQWGKVLGVPQEVLERQPSAGLWENQTDEGEMGTTYAYIDAHLEGKQIPEKDREIIEKLHKNTQHKRELPPYPLI